MGVVAVHPCRGMDQTLTHRERCRKTSPKQRQRPALHRGERALVRGVAVGPEQLGADIQAYIAGDDAAGDRICRHLEQSIRLEVGRFLMPDDPEREDVVQDSLLSMLAYLRRAGRAPDRPEAFVVTIAGNRCRNLYRWRKRRTMVRVDDAEATLSEERGPLDMLEAREIDALLEQAFKQLPAECRDLLTSIYSQERPMEELQREAGLGSLQGIYYRKYACLKKLSELFNRGLLGGRYGRAKRPTP